MLYTIMVILNIHNGANTILFLYQLMRLKLLNSRRKNLSMLPENVSEGYQGNKLIEWVVFLALVNSKTSILQIDM